MFQIHGLTGHIARARADELRRVQRVQSSAPTRATERIAPPQTETSHASVEVHWHERADPHDPGTDPRTAALHAYTQVQQDLPPEGSNRTTQTMAAQWMSSPAISVAHAQPAPQALALLQERGIGQAPVLDDNGQLVGLLLRKDLLDEGQALARLFVHDCMRSPVPSGDPSLDLRHVARALITTDLPGLPLVDPQGALVGFIARGDVLRAAAAEPALDLWG